jgi:RNA polymerase sigma-70 factor (ECF subfamily)
VTATPTGPRHRLDESAAPGRADRRQRDRFERIFHEEYGAVLAYAVMRADLELAKDAAAQTFLVAWRRREELPDPPRAWLLGVTRRTLADLRRSRNRQEALRSRLAGVEGTSGKESEAFETATEREVVGLALDRLPDSDAELLRLVYWDGLSCRQAADSLSCSVTALKVRLHRARHRFQREIEQLDNVGRGPCAHPHPKPAPTPCNPVPTSRED